MDDADVPEAVTAYLDRIGRTPLLTAPQERALGVRIRAGRAAEERLRVAATGERAALAAAVVDGQEARRALVAANLRLVVHQARRLPRGTVPLLDLVQEGNIGLLSAADGFDPSLGFRFSTYAHDWIAQAMWAALSADRLVRLPARAGNRLAQCRRARAEIHTDRAGGADLEQVAAVTGYPPAHVGELMRADQAMLPLEEAVAVVAADDPCEPAHRRDTHRRLRAALERVPGEEREVLELRYGLGVPGEGCSLVETARRTGADVSRVRRLERRALARLREADDVAALREGAEGW